MSHRRDDGTIPRRSRREEVYVLNFLTERPYNDGV